MRGQPIPPYTEADERAAREALDQLQPRPFEPLVELAVREVAGAIATARTEGRREVILATTRLVSEGECACVSCVAAELGVER